ncbi:Transposable element P transposase [Lucilia cuprina]|nr:Transposable element P transposase [Lucilia cuprina]
MKLCDEISTNSYNINSVEVNAAANVLEKHIQVPHYTQKKNIVENFFSNMRGRGAFDDHPSPIQFIYRFRKYLLACLQYTDDGIEDLWENIDDNETEIAKQANELTCVIENDFDCFEEDALEYVAGYIIQKLKLTNSESKNDEGGFTWVNQVSKGGLKKPNSLFLNKLKQIEILFRNINGDSISNISNLTKYMLDKSSENDLPENVKSFFFKIGKIICEQKND